MRDERSVHGAAKPLTNITYYMKQKSLIIKVNYFYSQKQSDILKTF